MIRAKYALKMDPSESNKMEKESLLRRVKELENQIETLRNTKRNTTSSSHITAAYPSTAEVSLIEMWNKVDDVGVRLTNVYSENKSLKERIKELEGDQNEMEDRIYYLERKLYSLDAYTTNKAISPEAKSPPELNMMNENSDGDFHRPHIFNDHFRKKHEENLDNENRHSNHESSRKNNRRCSSEPPLFPSSEPPFLRTSSSHNGSPLKQNVVQNQSEIEMVRIAGKKLVGKVKQFSIRRNIEVRCSSLDVSLDELTSHNMTSQNNTNNTTKTTEQRSETRETATGTYNEHLYQEQSKAKNVRKEKEEARMTSDTSDSDDVRSSSEDASNQEDDDEDEPATPVINLTISSRWNNIEITRASNNVDSN